MYPEYAKQAAWWLDASRGAASASAAVLRLMDGDGFGRASGWCPGLLSKDSLQASSQPLQMYQFISLLGHLQARLQLC